VSSEADLKMDHTALDERLAELGISIPGGTLALWAAESFIPRPISLFQKEKKTGRASFV
jgi:hypothetical protein